MKIRFYITDINENEPFSRVIKNFECVINAALMSKGYNKKCAAYQLLGDEYEVVIKHLKKTVRNFDYRSKYKLVKKVNKYLTIEELAKSYYYKNLKLEKILIEQEQLTQVSK